MRILVTAGSTQCPIDKVRAITNIFRGNTGVNIAYEAAQRGHEVVLLGSPSAYNRMMDLAGTLRNDQVPTSVKFRTFDDLSFQLKTHLSEGWDAVVQSAAVSDYRVDSIFPTSESIYNYLKLGYEDNENPAPDVGSGKIDSKLDEMYLRLVPTYKLVDKIREWGLGHGTLVKFKLEVDIPLDRLIMRADKSCEESDADIMVANLLDDFQHWERPAIVLMDREGKYKYVSRAELSVKLLDLIESPTRKIEP